MVEYAYDAWDKLMSTTGSMATMLGQDNPFRYRGYYFDTETGLYYLNQRYYNSEWGRFVNADDELGKTGALLSHNLFAYCGNNPVMNVDPSGQSFWSVLTDVLTVVAIVAVVVAVAALTVASGGGALLLAGAIGGTVASTAAGATAVAGAAAATAVISSTAAMSSSKIGESVRYSNNSNSHNTSSKRKTIQPKNPKKVSDYKLQQNGYDAHEIKREVLGRKSIDILKYNIYKDNDRSLWLLKNGTSKYLRTGWKLLK